MSMAARKLLTILVVLLAFGVGLTAAPVGVAPARAATGDSVVLTWNQQVLDSTRETGTAATIAARALAVVHTASDDAWAAYDPVAVGTRLGAGLRQPAAERTLDNKNRAVSFAAYAALVDLFPARQAVYGQQMADLGYAIDGSDASTAASVGTVAAQAVLDYRHHDGANQLGDEPGGSPGVAYSDYTGYRPVNTWDRVKDPDRWQPLCIPLPPPGATECTGRIQTFLTPFWARVEPFALTRPDQFRPPGPYTYLGPDGRPSGKYVDQIDKMTQYSKQLDDFRKTTAEYWEDGRGTVTPPGHWNQFAQWVARRDADTIDEDARLFFALNGALLDASISAWDGKRTWDSIRPISAVRWLRRGQIIQAWGGPYKGPSYIKYGGIHFEHGDKDARAAGASVGRNAWAKALTYFNGTATP
jgi:hypothetical protein